MCTRLVYLSLESDQCGSGRSCQDRVSRLGDEREKTTQQSISRNVAFIFFFLFDLFFGVFFGLSACCSMTLKEILFQMSEYWSVLRRLIERKSVVGVGCSEGGTET